MINTRKTNEVITRYDTNISKRHLKVQFALY